MLLWITHTIYSFTRYWHLALSVLPLNTYCVSPRVRTFASKTIIPYRSRYSPKGNTDTILFQFSHWFSILSKFSFPQFKSQLVTKCYTELSWHMWLFKQPTLKNLKKPIKLGEHDSKKCLAMVSYMLALKKNQEKWMLYFIQIYIFRVLAIFFGNETVKVTHFENGKFNKRFHQKENWS